MDMFSVMEQKLVQMKAKGEDMMNNYSQLSKQI